MQKSKSPTVTMLETKGYYVSSHLK